MWLLETDCKATLVGDGKMRQEGKEANKGWFSMFQWATGERFILLGWQGWWETPHNHQVRGAIEGLMVPWHSSLPLGWAERHQASRETLASVTCAGN